MAHKSKYTKTGNPNSMGYVGSSRDLHDLGEIPASAVLSPHQAAKDAMSNEGKHKGSVLYTKYDK
jgi:hypothetical protein